MDPLRPNYFYYKLKQPEPTLQPTPGLEQFTHMRYQLETNNKFKGNVLLNKLTDKEELIKLDLEKFLDNKTMSIFVYKDLCVFLSLNSDPSLDKYYVRKESWEENQFFVIPRRITQEPRYFIENTIAKEHIIRALKERNPFINTIEQASDFLDEAYENLF